MKQPNLLRIVTKFQQDILVYNLVRNLFTAEVSSFETVVSLVRGIWAPKWPEEIQVKELE